MGTFMDLPLRQFIQRAETDTVTLGDRLAELVYRNGGAIRVTGWGVIELGGPYGSRGLMEEEALELTYLGGVIRGYLLQVPPNTEREIIRWIEHAWKVKTKAASNGS